MKIQDWIKGRIKSLKEEYGTAMNGSFETIYDETGEPITINDLLGCLSFDVFGAGISIDDFEVKAKCLIYNQYGHAIDATTGFMDLLKAQLKKAYPNIGWNKNNVLMWNI